MFPGIKFPKDSESFKKAMELASQYFKSKGVDSNTVSYWRRPESDTEHQENPDLSFVYTELLDKSNNFNFQFVPNFDSSKIVLGSETKTERERKYNESLNTGKEFFKGVPVKGNTPEERQKYILNSTAKFLKSSNAHPIGLYKMGNQYLVWDGAHRAWIAQKLGLPLKAYVVTTTKESLTEKHIRSQVRKVLLNEMEKIYGFDVIGIAGSGDNGMAYELSNGNILKITKSPSEAYIAHKLIGKNLKHVANVYWVKKIEDKYIYELEKLDTNWSDSDRQLWDVLIMIIDDDYMLEEFQNMSHNEKIAYLTELGFDEREGIPDDSRINFFINGLKSVSQELESTHKSLLKAMDLGIDNFGIKNGELAVFDLDYQTNLVDTSIEDL